MELIIGTFFITNWVTTVIAIFFTIYFETVYTMFNNASEIGKKYYYSLKYESIKNYCSYFFEGPTTVGESLKIISPCLMSLVASRYLPTSQSYLTLKG